MFRKVLLGAILLGVSFTLTSCFRPEPVASLQAPDETAVNEEVVFDASSSVGVDFFYWDFGDGTEPLKTEEKVVKHTYNQEGDYTVRLKARNTSFSWNQGEPDCITYHEIIVVAGILPGPTPCDTNPIVHISLSSTNIELGEDVVVTVTATDPTGGLIELTSAIVTPPSGSVNKQEFSSLNGHLQFTVTGNEENAWHILVTCQNSCDTQEMTDTASASFLVYEDTPPPGPTPCDTNPIVHISLSSTNIELGEDVVVTVTATDPTGGLIELTSAIVTPPSGSVNKQEFSSLNGHLQFTVTGNEENAWHILVTCQNSCDTQEMTDTASASFLVYEDTPPPPTCQNPTLRAKIDGSYISNNSTLQREIGDSISLRIEAEDSDDCGPCGTSVDGISIIRVHVWKGNEANTVFSWDTSQGTMSLSNPFKTFSFNDEGTYGIDTTVQDDDCDRHREAELHFLIEVEDPEIPPEQPVYELDVSNLTRPSGPNYTCHQIAAIIRMVSGEAEGPMSIRWGDGNESSGLTGIHQYSEADGHVIQALNGAGEVVAYASINIQFRECVAPEIEVISAPPSDAFVGDSYLVSIKGSDEDQEWTSCLCQDSCVAGHGIYRAQINVFDPSGNVVKNLELECSEVAFPMTLTGTFDEVGDYRVVIWIEDDDNLCGCLCNCAHNDNEELIIHVTQRP